MFTVVQIKAAHSKVRNGADFPRYIADIAGLGVRRYVTYVQDGHSVYHGDNGFSDASPASYPVQTISPQLQGEAFKARLEAHQRGETTYPQFCSDCADWGVDRWEVDLTAMTCTYFSSSDQLVLVEDVPSVQ